MTNVNMIIWKIMVIVIQTVWWMTQEQILGLRRFF
jgi:hypothetical protein